MRSTPGRPSENRGRTTPKSWNCTTRSRFPPATRGSSPISPPPCRSRPTILSARAKGATETLEPGTYYLNPYVQEVRLVDCRSQPTTSRTSAFPRRTDFGSPWRRSSNFASNPTGRHDLYSLQRGTRRKALGKEVINKVILPNARAYTRLRGSNHSGKEFITGDIRTPSRKIFRRP